MVLGILRVVSILTREESEHGWAYKRESKRLGYPPDNFKATLFYKDFAKLKCVFCDISTWDKARFDEHIEDYLHNESPASVHNIGVKCLGCSKFQCRQCLVSIQVNIPAGHLDFLHLPSYLAGDPSSSFTISRCSCCSPRKRMVSCDGIKADRTSKICFSLPEQPLFV